MLFCSNFNGTWDQYIDAFSDGIPSGLDLFWYSSTHYPHSVPITAFKDYIRANQIDTDYYYNSVPGAAQRDVKAALRVRRAILALAQQHSDGLRGLRPSSESSLCLDAGRGSRTTSAPGLRAGRQPGYQGRGRNTARTTFASQKDARRCAVLNRLPPDRGTTDADHSMGDTIS